MPKVSKTGKFRKTAAAEVAAVVKKKDDEAEAGDGSSAALSRGQRRRQAKRDQYQKKQELILSALQLKGRDEQKKRLDGLDGIRDALMATVSKGLSATADDAEKVNLLKNNKSRQLLVEKEGNQLSLVMQHPAFKADPFATIREHLQNTLASDAAEQKRQEARHIQERKEKDEKRREQRKEHAHKKRKHRVRPTRSKK